MMMYDGEAAREETKNKPTIEDYFKFMKSCVWSCFQSKFSINLHFHSAVHAHTDELFCRIDDGMPDMHAIK